MNAALRLSIAAIASLTAGCAPDASTCGADFPEAPPGAVVHVAAQCPEAGADGSAAHPFPTISEALAVADVGAAVVVAAGDYAENLDITRDVSVFGAGDAGARGDGAGVVLRAPAANAITIEAGATATIQGFHVALPRRVGIWAKGGAATVSRTRVEGAALDGDVGYGLAASDGGSIEVDDSTVTGSARYGALISGATGVVVSSSFTRNRGGGVRLDTSSATIVGSEFDGNAGFGVGVFSSRVVVADTTIAGTSLDDDGLGDGIVANAISSAGGVPLGDAFVDVHDSTIRDCARVGVYCAAGTRGVVVRDNMISDNGVKGDVGAGVLLFGDVGGDPGSVISGNQVLRSRFAGVAFIGATTTLLVQGNAIAGTTSGTVLSGGTIATIGDGLSVVGGAAPTFSANTLSDNARCGAIVDGAAGVAAIAGNLVERNQGGGVVLQRVPDAASLGANDYGAGNGGFGDAFIVPKGQELPTLNGGENP